MGNLLQNEWLKIRYCKQLWFLVAAIACFVALMSFAPGAHYPLADSGCTASFVYFRECGCIVLMLLSCVIEIFFTRELQQGTLQNALGCGISRGRYFAVKYLSYLGTGMLIYLLSMIENLCIRTALYGFWPESGLGYPYSDYLATLIAYHFGSCIPICALLSTFMLVAVCVRKPAVVYMAGVVVCIVDLQLDMVFPGWKGIYAVLFDLEDMVTGGELRVEAFAALSVQCIVSGISFLALAYLIFWKKDIH